MENHTPLEVLSNDEKKAAEAAFARRPFNPAWSEKARLVYEGIMHALPASQGPLRRDDGTEVNVEETVTPITTESPSASSSSDRPTKEHDAAAAKIPFDQALEAGALIDVTSAARQVGILFAVCITKPLWDLAIAPSDTATEEQRSARLRDVLMAFRLRLAAHPTVSPLMDFPALLTLLPDAVPQPVPLFALIQPGADDRATATLLLPNEISLGIIPLNS
jgi:hypothetical protein